MQRVKTARASKVKSFSTLPWLNFCAAKTMGFDPPPSARRSHRRRVPWPLGRSCARSADPCSCPQHRPKKNRPLRKTVTWSAIASTSSRKCEMKMRLRPSWRSWRRTRNSLKIWRRQRRCRLVENDDAGAGKKHGPSSTSCWMPTGSEPMRVRGSKVETETGDLPPRSFGHAAQSITPPHLVGCVPKNTFSATVKSGTTDSS